MARLRKAGVEKIGFAWAGEAERGKKHYYRIQGPTFLVEYDNTQNDGNHIHSVWRDFNGDFGRDLLREHLRVVAALTAGDRAQHEGHEGHRRQRPDTVLRFVASCPRVASC